MQKAGHQVGGGGFEHLRATLPPLVEHLAGRTGDAPDHMGVIKTAAVGEGGISRCQLHRTDTVGHGAQGKCQIAVPVIQRNAHLFQIITAGWHADVVHQRHGGYVQAVLQSGAHAHVAVVGIAGVTGFVAIKVGGFVPEDAGGHVAIAVDGGGIGHQRLEGRTGLAAQVGGTVKAAPHLIFPPAYDGQHFAGAHIHAGCRSLHRGAVAGFCGKQILLELGIQRILMGTAQGGFDGEAAGQYLIAAQTQNLLCFIQRRIHEPAIGHFFRGLLCQHQLFGSGFVVGFLGDHSLAEHGG